MAIPIVKISGRGKPFCRSHQVWKKSCLLFFHSLAKTKHTELLKQAESGDTKTTGSAIALFESLGLMLLVAVRLHYSPAGQGVRNKPLERTGCYSNKINRISTLTRAT
jgi:hypothetical protein